MYIYIHAFQKRKDYTGTVYVYDDGDVYLNRRTTNGLQKTVVHTKMWTIQKGISKPKK
jgi:hypothetical protein